MNIRIRRFTDNEEMMRKGNMKRIYLFDFDGTLVDSMPTFGAVMLQIPRDYGVSVGDDLVKIVTPLGYVGSADYYRTVLGIHATAEELVARMKAEMQDAYAERIEAKAGVAETLRTLKSSGASLNVLTASPHVTLDCCLKRLGLWELFDHVWSCEDFHTTKSDPAIYRAAAKELGCPVSSVIFVDDNLGAVSTAKEAGAIAYGIYDPSSEDVREELRAVAHRYLEAFSDLLNEC